MTKQLSAKYKQQ